MYVIGHPLLAIASMLDSILFIYSLIVFAVCVLSFVNPDPNSPVVRILNQLTQPVFVYCRRYIPSINGFDLVPLVILLGISFVRMGIIPVFMQFADSLIK